MKGIPRIVTNIDFKIKVTVYDSVPLSVEQGANNSTGLRLVRIQHKTLRVEPWHKVRATGYDHYQRVNSTLY